MILPLLAAVSLWLSAGTVAITGGDTHRIAALPSIWMLGGIAVAAVAAARFTKLRTAEAWPLAISLVVWLPFLPGPIPAAFLLWQGPIEGIVWLVVAAGLIAARPPAVPRLFADSGTAPVVAGVVLAASAVLAFSQVRAVIPGGDEPHYLAATQSLLHDADLRVANNYAAGEYLEYFPGRLKPHFLQRAASGEIYSIHAPGVSVIVLPAFAIAGYAGAVVTMILIAALTAALCWRIAWCVSGRASAAWISVLAVFGTAPYFFHTFTIYPEIIGGFCVTAAVWLLLELSDDAEPSTRKLVAIGSALAVLPWLHSRFAVLAGLLGLIVVIRLSGRPRSRSAIAAFLAVPAIAGVAWFAYFWLIWGSPSPAAPYGPDTSTSASYILRGLIGLLVDQQFGMLTTAPVYLIAFAGVFELFRRRPRLTIELAIVVIGYALTVASYQMWWAGAAAPVRFLVAILPLAVLPIAAFAAGSRRAIAVLLLIVSAALVVPRAGVEGGRFIFNNRAPVDATLEWLSQIVDLPSALPSVDRDGGAVALRDGVVWIAFFVGAMVVAAFVRRTSAARWTVSALALAMASMLAATVAWGFHGVPGATSQRAKLAALGAFRPAWHTALVDLSERRLLSTSDYLSAMAVEIPSPLARLNRVPAGEYQVAVNTAGPPAGPITFAIGRNDSPIEPRQFEDPAALRSGFRLRLPVAVQTLNLATPGVVAQARNWLTITPVAVAAPASRRNAVRAARYGHARAFFFDEWAYLEPDGFWTRAGGTADVVIDSGDAKACQAGLPITVTAGAVATTIQLSMGHWSESLSLTPGQRHELMLPPGESGVWPLRIRSGAGFRPSEREPGSHDVRLLAAWIAFP